MSLLALVAMSLLVLVPTIGRLVSPGHHSSFDGVHDHAAMMAHAHLGDAGHDESTTPTPKPTGGGMSVHDDCAYCPVLNAMVSLLLWFVFVLPMVAMPPSSTRRAPLPHIHHWHPCGLGSRGPPIFL